jgi:uncharacterized protein (DUF1499 family)
MGSSLRLAAAAAAALSCAGTAPMPGSPAGGSRLAPCPGTPNCVSSDASDARHAVEAFELDPRVEPAVAWAGVREAVGALPRTRIVDEASGYLRAESRSRIFRFVDDLELELRSESRTVAVRSASRLGRSDFGVNRARVERLRALLRERALVR